MAERHAGARRVGSAVKRTSLDPDTRPSSSSYRPSRASELVQLLRAKLFGVEHAVISVLASAGGLGVSMTRIERLVLGHRLVGDEPDLRQTELAGVVLGTGEQKRAIAAPLRAGGHGDGVEQQMVAVHLVDDDSGDLAVGLDHPHPRRHDGGTVIGTHRRRWSSDPGDVLAESRMHDALDGRHIGQGCPANLDKDHRADVNALQVVASYSHLTARLREKTVQYFVQFDVHQPVDMSREELFAIWLEEARAAQGAVDAGAVTNLWKVVGQRSVFAVLDVPDHTSLDQALESLPIIQKLGGSVDTRAYPIRPYSEWAEELRVAVEGD